MSYTKQDIDVYDLAGFTVETVTHGSVGGLRILGRYRGTQKTLQIDEVGCGRLEISLVGEE